MSFQISPVYKMRLKELVQNELNNSKWNGNLKKLNNNILSKILPEFIKSFENKERGNEIFSRITNCQLSSRPESERRIHEETPTLMDRIRGAIYDATLAFLIL